MTKTRLVGKLLGGGEAAVGGRVNCFAGSNAKSGDAQGHFN